MKSDTGVDVLSLRQALIEGENSGEADELDMKKVKSEGAAAVEPLMRKILLGPLAERDLIGIWQYSLAQWGEEQADHYLDDACRADIFELPVLLLLVSSRASSAWIWILRGRRTVRGRSHLRSLIHKVPRA